MYTIVTTTIAWLVTFFIDRLYSLVALYASCLVDTNQVSLEQIAGKFGDKSASLENLDLQVEGKQNDFYSKVEIAEIVGNEV